MSHYKAVSRIRVIIKRLEERNQMSMAAELEESLEAVIDSHFEIVMALWEATKGTKK
jgi:hypothetical protein